MNKHSLSLLTAALGLALCAGAGANEEQTTAQTVTPTPTSSTAKGNTAQQTAEGATASSFESRTATNAQAQIAAPAAGSTSTEANVATTARPTFDALDTDRDGFLAKTELPAGHGLAAAWAQYDTDNDAKLARADFDRYASTLKPSFVDLDTNRDGFIARTELPAGHALIAVWSEYDADNDARIARSDFDRYLLAAYPSFTELDRNTDGKLSRAELPSTHALYTGFASFDTDGDTKLSRAEFDAYGAGGAAAVASTGEADEGDEEAE